MGWWTDGWMGNAVNSGWSDKMLQRPVMPQRMRTAGLTEHPGVEWLAEILTLNVEMFSYCPRWKPQPPRHEESGDDWCTDVWKSIPGKWGWGWGRTCQGCWRQQILFSLCSSQLQCPTSTLHITPLGIKSKRLLHGCLLLPEKQVLYLVKWPKTS